VHIQLTRLNPVNLALKFLVLSLRVHVTPWLRLWRSTRHRQVACKAGSIIFCFNFVERLRVCISRRHTMYAPLSSSSIIGRGKRRRYSEAGKVGLTPGQAAVAAGLPPYTITKLSIGYQETRIGSCPTGYRKQEAPLPRRAQRVRRA